MRSNAYVHAVDNLDALLNRVKKTNLLFPEDIDTLSYNVFILKMMPLYTGIERKPDVADR